MFNFKKKSEKDLRYEAASEAIRTELVRCESLRDEYFRRSLTVEEDLKGDYFRKYLEYRAKAEELYHLADLISYSIVYTT